MVTFTRRTALGAIAATAPVALWGFGADAATPKDSAVIA